MSEDEMKTMRNDEDKKGSSTWDVFGNDQKTSVGKRVSYKEVGIHLVITHPWKKCLLGGGRMELRPLS